jgi:hypothetical protein
MTRERAVFDSHPTLPPLNGCPLLAPAYLGQQRRGEAPSTVYLFLTPTRLSRFVIPSVPGFPASPLSLATTYVVLPNENHIQSTEGATLDRKSGEAEGSAVFFNPLNRRSMEAQASPLSSRPMWRDLQFCGPLVETPNTILKQKKCGFSR